MAINAYNRSDDQRLKNKIYNRFIHYPFDKLVENVIHTYKTYYFNIPYNYLNEFDSNCIEIHFKILS